MAVLLGFDSNYKGLAYNVSKGAYRHYTWLRSILWIHAVTLDMRVRRVGVRAEARFGSVISASLLI